MNEPFPALVCPFGEAPGEERCRRPGHRRNVSQYCVGPVCVHAAQLGEEVRGGDHVVVEEQQQLALCQCCPAVACSCGSGVRLLDHPHRKRRGDPRRARAVLSVEPSTTTMTSSGGTTCPASALTTWVTSARRWKVGTTTECLVELVELAVTLATLATWPRNHS